MRAIWSGAISFGLVNIPIKLYSGAEDHEFHLRMLHEKDKSPIRYARICQVEEHEVPYKEIVKAYEYQKDEYIIISEEDFEKANVHATHTIDIVNFTDEHEIDIRYFEKPYYLEPGKGADKAYALLKEALTKTKKVGIAKFVIHNREHLAVIKPSADILILNQMRFASQLRSFNDIKVPKNKDLKQIEIDMAIALVKQLTGHFKADLYHDTYSEDLERIIENKIKGHKIVAKGKVPSKTAAKNLINALKASLKASRGQTRKTSS